MRRNTRIPPEPLGWPLLATPQAGQLRYPSLEESVRQSIKIILLTRPGEQLMNPEFGAGLDGYLHEPNTVATRRSIRDEIMGALDLWEPRIDVVGVDVRELEHQPQAVRVEIAYRLRRTGTLKTLALSMQMGS